MALTNAEKQAALRKRRAKLEQKELRGIWVSNDEDKELKTKIRAWLKKMRKGT